MRKLMAISLLCILAAPCAAAPDVTGTWITQDGDGAVEIAPCGNSLCGRIVWLRSPLDENGRPVRDENNADTSLRSRPLCGAEIISGVHLIADSWEGGSIYDPESGSRYSVALARAADDTLSVTGYLGLKTFGQTFDWHRAPDTLKRCDGTAKPEVKAKARSVSREP